MAYYMLAHTSQGYATTPSMQGYLRWGTSDEPLPSLPKVLFGFKFSQKYMNFISKKHFNFERKEGRA
jgi:hypothetical protein